MILIVEDGPEMATVFAKALARAGYEVTVVSTGMAALNELLTCNYRLALIDLALPDINGAELAALARGRGCDTPMIAISGAMGLIDPELIEPAGFVAALGKPMRITALIDLVREHASPAGLLPT
jgi:CheY-like chemotaxis protein